MFVVVNLRYGTYYGEINLEGKPHGKGMVEHAGRKDLSIGEFYNGELHGSCVITTGDTSVIYGQFVHGFLDHDSVSDKPTPEFAKLMSEIQERALKLKEQYALMEEEPLQSREYKIVRAQKESIEVARTQEILKKYEHPEEEIKSVEESLRSQMLEECKPKMLEVLKPLSKSELEFRSLEIAREMLCTQENDPLAQTAEISEEKWELVSSSKEGQNLVSKFSGEKLEQEGDESVLAGSPAKVYDLPVDPKKVFVLSDNEADLIRAIRYVKESTSPYRDKGLDMLKAMWSHFYLHQYPDPESFVKPEETQEFVDYVNSLHKDIENNLVEIISVSKELSEVWTNGLPPLMSEEEFANKKNKVLNNMDLFQKE